MHIRSLRLVSFRAHADSTLRFAPKVNLLYGPNGAGKTNVLEAIHYLCLGKSFLASKDSYALRKGAPFFEIEGRFESDNGRDVTMRLAYVPVEGKRIFVNRAPLERLSQVIGIVPLVVFSPEDQALTAGGPDERRRFMDNILSQARPVYLNDLLSYRRTLKQRNELLVQGRYGSSVRGQDGVLESWTEELVVLGSRLIAARFRFVAEFDAFLRRAFECLQGDIEEPTLAYHTVVTPDAGLGLSDIERAYRAQLGRVARRERELGRTLAGPHLDELVFKLNGMEVRRFASQGQHRTFGMAMKLAQYFYLRDRLEENPIFLLDDVFGNLDPKRTRLLLELLQTDAVGQSIITAAHAEPLLSVLSIENGVNHAAEILSGRVATPGGLG